MHHLIVGPQLFRLAPLGDGGGIIAPGVISAAEGQLRVEMFRLFRQDGLQPFDGGIGLAGAELEHRFIKLLLQTHLLPKYTPTAGANASLT